MNNVTIKDVVQAIKKSFVWKDLNNKYKQAYKKNDRVPSNEEYQILRNVLISKVILEDPKVHKIMIQYIYCELCKQ